MQTLSDWTEKSGRCGRRGRCREMTISGGSSGFGGQFERCLTVRNFHELKLP